MKEKRWLAKFTANNTIGRVRQFQALVYLSFLLNIVFIIVFLMIIWELNR